MPAVLPSFIIALGRPIEQEDDMPRYLVERTFPEGFALTVDDIGAKAAADVVARNADDGVTWIHSYVTNDRRTTYCIYDGQSPESIRHAASCNSLPIDRLVEVRVLDPYFYR